jgi:transposase
MIGGGDDVRILVATQPIDFRAGINRLVSLIAQSVGGDPYDGRLYVFRSKRLDRLKAIRFDGSGVILATKWLEVGKFHWPPVRGGVVTLSGPEYAALLSGLDWTKLAARPVPRPTISG